MKNKMRAQLRIRQIQLRKI